MHFPTSGVDVFPLWPLLVAFGVSFCSSLGGVSGAFLLMPYQVSILGFTAPAVTPTNLVFNIVAIPSGIYRFIREGRMLWSLAGVMAAGLVPGVTLGAYVRLRYLPDPGAFKMFVGCVLLYIGARLIWDIAATSRRGPGREDRGGRVRTTRFGLTRVTFSHGSETHAYNPLWILLLMVVLGVVGGAYGIGGGAIVAPIVVSVFRLPVHSIAGATLASTFLTSVTGVAVYTWIVPRLVPGAESTTPDLLLGGILGLGGLAGIYLGARLQKHVPARVIKVLLAAILLFVALRYVIEFFV